MPRKDVRLGWRPDQKDHRDMIFGDVFIPKNLPDKLDLSQVWNVPVVDQGQLGSCTGNGIASALAYLQLKEGESMIYPSRLFIYYNERVTEGTINEDAGAEIRDGIKSVVDLGYCPETDWPYDISKFMLRPSDMAYADAAKDLVKTYQRVLIRSYSVQEAIATGYPVVVGFTVYDSFMASTDGNIPMPSADDAIAGGHCVLVVGYDQVTRLFKFQNSWGTGWGDKGFGYIPFDYIGNALYGGDYWIVTGDESQGPNPFPPSPTPFPQPQPPVPPTPPPLPGNGCNPFGTLLTLFK